MEKLLFRASKEVAHKEYGNITLGFFNVIIGDYLKHYLSKGNGL